MISQATDARTCESFYHAERKEDKMIVTSDMIVKEALNINEHMLGAPLVEHPLKRAQVPGSAFINSRLLRSSVFCSI